MPEREDLSSDPSTSMESGSGLREPVTSPQRQGGRGGSLATRLMSMFSERTHLKGITQGMVEQDSQHPPPTSTRVLTGMCTYTHVHIHTTQTLTHEIMCDTTPVKIQAAGI